MVSKKIRIQVWDPEGEQLHDKLTDQNTTIAQGPLPEFKDGLLKMEICLFEPEDVDKVITYLRMVKGDIPLGRILKHKKNPKVGVSEENAGDFRQELVTDFDTIESQEELTKTLRERGFRFLTWDDGNDSGLFELVNISSKMEKKLKSFQIMVRVSKDSKNPLNVKYDPMLLFFIKIITEEKAETSPVYVYLNGTLNTKGDLKVTSTDSILNSANITVFPHFMVADERNKFRLEVDKLKKKPEIKPSKFFKRWAPFIEFNEKEEIQKIHGKFKSNND